jgi:hypothetical protein
MPVRKITQNCCTCPKFGLRFGPPEQISVSPALQGHGWNGNAAPNLGSAHMERMSS